MKSVTTRPARTLARLAKSMSMPQNISIGTTALSFRKLPKSMFFRVIAICIDSFILILKLSFRARFYRLAGPKNAKRWETLCQAYTDCVATEAELREQGKVLPLKDFIPLRRNNSAVVLCFALNEYNLGIDLDDEVYQDETFSEAYWAAVDHVCWG